MLRSHPVVPEGQAEAFHQTENAEINEGFRRNLKHIHRLGIVQCAMGSLSMLFGVISLFYAAYSCSMDCFLSERELGFLLIGSGVWCGISILTAGVLGIMFGNKTKFPYVVASLVLSIFASLFATILLGLETGAALVVMPSFRYVYEQNEYILQASGSTTLTVLHGFLCAIAIAEITIATMQSAFYCNVLRCKLSQVGALSQAQNLHNLPQYAWINDITNDVLNETVSSNSSFS